MSDTKYYAVLVFVASFFVIASVALMLWFIFAQRYTEFFVTLVVWVLLRPYVEVAFKVAGEHIKRDK